MNQPKYLWVIMACMCFCTGLTWAAPKKNNKKSSDDHNSDLIPIPDDLLENYNMPSDDLNEILPNEDSSLVPNISEVPTSSSSLEVSSSSPPPFGDTGSKNSNQNNNNNKKKLLLPEKILPPSSGGEGALPIFLKEPSDTFLIKSRPATLHCRVAHALRVYFQCNSEAVEPTTIKNHVEPESGVRYTEASVDILRDKVEEYFSDYHCACVAISSKGSVISKKHALVAIAYLKKHFEVPPYSQQVALGSQVQMRCHPPKGKPAPTIKWLQNGSPISPLTDKNFIITGEGHLIVVNATLADTANYTCVAENVATKRLSAPATINVYVDGGWSSWSTWSGCLPKCGKGSQKRMRQCNSPTPINGGAPCAGLPIQKKPCSKDCPGVPGGWSVWSSWSSCSPECFQHRRRTCTNPEPSKRGSYCDGIDLQSKNCTHGFCQDTGHLVMYGNNNNHDDNGNMVSSTTSGGGGAITDLTLYIVFGVALVVFILVIIIIVKILKRKNPNPNGYTLTSTDYGYGTDDSTKKAGLGYSPDITHHVTAQSGGSGGGTVGSSSSHSNNGNTHGHITPTTVCYEYSYPDSNSNHSKSGFLRPLSEHHYEQPMVVLPPSQSPSDSLDKPSRSDTSSSISNHGGLVVGGLQQGHTGCSPSENGNIVMQPRILFPVTSTPLPSLMTQAPPPPPPTNPPPLRHSITTNSSSSSSNLPPQSPDPRFTSWASVTSAGARIILPDCDVCVTIPPGAVSQGRSLDLYVSVIHHARPPLSPKETLLSPLVCLGPREAAVQLKKAVILSLPHCASLRHGHWRVSLLQSEAECFHNDNDHLRPWSRAVTLGQETLNTPAYVQLDVNNAHVMTDVLATFALAGESASSGVAVKSLQLAAFAQEGGHRGPDLTVRVYVLPDNVAALAYVTESERRYNGRLLDKPMSFLMKDGGQDMCLRVEDVNSTWGFQKGADYLEVPFNHIWQAANTNLHCSFTFRCRDRCGSASASKLALTISVSQKNATSSTSKNVLRVHCDLNQPPQNGNSSSSSLQHQLLLTTAASSSTTAATAPRSSPASTLTTTASAGGTMTSSTTSSNNNNFLTGNGSSVATAAFGDPLSGRFRLSANMLASLAKLLDPPTPEGHDWRLLAERLNVHRYVTFFATRPSPTEAILHLWEARNREILALSNLINILRGMGRFDAAAVLEQQMH